MGEEKEEEKKKVEGKEEKKTEEEPPEIVLKVDMYCEACARKVARALKGFQGVEAVSVDSKANKVVVKGKAADPAKVCERLQKKSGRKVELISPLPKPPQNKEEKQEVKEEKKEEAPAIITVVLKVQMHCEACAQVLQRRIRKIQGVEAVETDVGTNQVIVRGVVDPAMLVEYVYKRTRKQASIVKEEKKKEEGERKEEGEKDGEPEKSKEEEEKKMSESESESEIKKLEYLPSKYSSEYLAYYPPPPQIFSDENPNACSLM